MLFLPGTLPPLCPPDVAMATPVPTWCCCVLGSYSIREAPMLLSTGAVMWQEVAAESSVD